MDAPAFTTLTDLAAARIGGQTLGCTDDFFAEVENLIMPGRGIFIADKYTDHGKWMDGWESRRKRTAGHDWAIVKLGAAGVIKGFDIDTNHFLGNHPPHASVEGICMDGNPDMDTLNAATWTELLPKSPLDPGSQHFFEINNAERWTHVKLHIYPDGGVARLRVYGEPFVDWDSLSADAVVDLAAAENGARSVACNDMFFSHMGNLIMPGRGVNMGDGWETKRNRTPNNIDWVVVRLAHPGMVQKLLVDTAHFKGNFPDRCSLEGAMLAPDADGTAADIHWETILPEQKLQADFEHKYTDEIAATGPFSHVRLRIYPDGGISRLRVWGRISK